MPAPRRPAGADAMTDDKAVPEIPEELWAFGSPEGRWIGNSSDKYVGCFLSHEDAKSVSHRLQCEDATGPHLVGVSPAVRDERDRLRGRVAELEAENAKLIDGLILQRFRKPTRTLANADDSGVWETVGWEWQYGGMGDTEGTRAEAVAALRRAAGLPADTPPEPTQP